MANKSTPPYLLARQHIVSYIEGGAAPGSALPSERTLCKELGISQPTVRKALAQLVVEGRVRCVHGKGNFITNDRAERCVGIVVGDGVGSVFLNRLSILSSVLDSLTRHGCSARFLSCHNSSELPDMFLHYKLDGALFLYPPPRVEDVIARSLAQGCPPVATLAPWDATSKPPFTSCAVLFDHAALGRLRAEHFLARGHRRIGYVGNLDERYEVFKRELAKAGVEHDPELCVGMRESVSARLPGILEFGVTALSADGGPERLEELFAVLAERSRDIHLEVPNLAKVITLRERFPTVKVGAIGALPSRRMGKEVVEMLLRGMESGEPQEPVKVPPELLAPEALADNLL